MRQTRCNIRFKGLFFASLPHLPHPLIGVAGGVRQKAPAFPEAPPSNSERRADTSDRRPLCRPQSLIGSASVVQNVDHMGELNDPNFSGPIPLM